MNPGCHPVMRAVVAFTAAAALLIPTATTARRIPTISHRSLPRVDTGSPRSLDVRPDVSALFAPAAPGTTFLGSWNFDMGGVCDAQGWTRLDLTAQEGDYFHVDNFAGLTSPKLVPLEGTKSMWCGARPSNTDPLCAYASLPGYGNSWDQSFATGCIHPTGTVSWDYLLSYDTEPGYDIVSIQWDRCDANWKTIRSFSGYLGPTLFNETITDTANGGNIRLRVQFNSDGAWSDEDGLWDTDGAVIVDSLTVSDTTGIVLPTETFEAEAIGAHTTNSGNWASNPRAGYGFFSDLFPGNQVLQQDPCVSNISCLWGFFSGSTANYACGGFPEQAAVPYMNASGLNMDEVLVSPDVPWLGSGASAVLEFDVYRDLALDGLVYYWYGWKFRTNGCETTWQKRDGFYYGASRDWLHTVAPFGDLVPPGATSLSVTLGARDMCYVWCGVFGTGSCHSNGPLFDNVTVYRVQSKGPQWSVRDVDLFQDTFPDDGTLSGTARADMALDVLPSTNPSIRPGDSVVVTVSEPEDTVAGDPYTGFGPAVYALVQVRPPGQPGKSGAALSDDASRWPVVDSLAGPGGTWYRVRMDSVFAQAGRGLPQPDRYCFDLNDNLFTAGDTVYYAFEAHSTNTGAVTYWSPEAAQTETLVDVLTAPAEFQVLPTGNSDILYVDGADGFGVQPFFETAFDALGIAPDRYDINGPSSLVGNRPGARVADAFAQVIGTYKTIIWSTGELSVGTIGDGNGAIGGNEKSDDASLLYTFLNQSPNANGVYFTGDDLAEEWNSGTGLAGSGANLYSYIQHTLVSGDHTAPGQTGEVAPLLVGEPGGCFAHPAPDTAIAYGGCPGINDFDVIAPAGASALLEMSYSGSGGNSGAVVSQQTVNAVGDTVAVVLSGLSFHNLRSKGAVTGVSVRAHHLDDVLTWLGQAHSIATATGPQALRNTLAQNYPNPFNPSTTIRFSLREKSPVTLKIYDARGRLVRTLVRGDVRAAGVTHTLQWDGRNDAGQVVSSGVYFYRLEAPGFSQTRKMVLLK